MSNDETVTYLDRQIPKNVFDQYQDDLNDLNICIANAKGRLDRAANDLEIAEAEAELRRASDEHDFLFMEMCEVAGLE